MDNKDKKLITLSNLEQYTTKVKEKLSQKLGNSGDQLLDGSLTTIGDVSIQGNLNVKGATQTVNQETLTVKDNLIAINSDGATLTTAGKAGLVIVDGGELPKLKNSSYLLDGEALMNYIQLNCVYIEGTEGYMGNGLNMTWNDSKLVELQNALNRLKPSSIEVPYEFTDYYDANGTFKSWSYCTNSYECYISAITDSSALEGKVFYWNATGNSANTTQAKLIFNEPQLIENSADIAIFKQILRNVDTNSFITDNDFILDITAYAAPIYDVESNTLKIGLGTYVKDEKGNIKDFTFGAGQAQAIATRNEDIQDTSILIWDNINKKMRGANLKFGDVASAPYISYYSDSDKKTYSLDFCKESGTIATQEYIDSKFNDLEKALEEVINGSY